MCHNSNETKKKLRKQLKKTHGYQSTPTRVNKDSKTLFYRSIQQLDRKAQTDVHVGEE